MRHQRSDGDVVKNPGFVIVAGERGRVFSFRFQTRNGEGVLRGDDHPTHAATLLAVQATREAASSEGSYERKRAPNGAYYFLLKAPEGRVLARSVDYKQAKGRDAAMRSVREEAPSAPVDAAEGGGVDAAPPVHPGLRHDHERIISAEADFLEEMAKKAPECVADPEWLRAAAAKEHGVAAVITAVGSGAGGGVAGCGQILLARLYVSPTTSTPRVRALRCTSSADFMVRGTLRVGPNAGFGIMVDSLGVSQGFESSLGLRTETFVVGGPAGSTIRVDALGAPVSGFVTLETAAGATASMTPQ